jgi:ABC-2 type transport system permease protein
MSRAEVRVPGGRLLRSELALLFRRRRTLALLLALVAIPVLVAVAVELSSTPPGPGEGPPFLDQVTQSGAFVAATSLVVAVPFFIPVTVAVVAGDSFAGEANQGTLRYLLLAPAGRTRLLVVKGVAVAVFCFAAPAAMAVVGMAVGTALFGFGDAASLSGGVLDRWDVLARVALLAGYIGVAMLGLAAFGLFVSTLTDVPVGAMAATVVLAIAAQILGGLSQLDWLHPWLLTDTWLDFADLLRSPLVWDSFLANVWLQAGWVAVFGALAWARLTSKDVLS